VKKKAESYIKSKNLLNIANQVGIVTIEIIKDDITN
jgi:hypothetical protein